MQADNEIEPESHRKKNTPSPVSSKVDSNQVTAEKRVKEKSSYKKLIANLQETYPDLSKVNIHKFECYVRTLYSGFDRRMP